MKVIERQSPPTEATVGAVGDLCVVTPTEHIYRCTRISGYTWDKIHPCEHQESDTGAGQTTQDLVPVDDVKLEFVNVGTMGVDSRIRFTSKYITDKNLGWCVVPMLGGCFTAWGPFNLDSALQSGSIANNELRIAKALKEAKNEVGTPFVTGIVEVGYVFVKTSAYDKQILREDDIVFGSGSTHVHVTVASDAVTQVEDATRLKIDYTPTESTFFIQPGLSTFDHTRDKTDYAECCMTVDGVVTGGGVGFEDAVDIFELIPKPELNRVYTISAFTFSKTRNFKLSCANPMKIMWTSSDSTLPECVG